MDSKARSVAFNSAMTLSCERGRRELTKEEILLHNQACRTLQLFLAAAEDDLRGDQDIILERGEDDCPRV